MEGGKNMLNIRNNLIFRLTAIGAVVALALAAVAVPLSARANVFSNGRVESLSLTSTPGNGVFYASGDVVTVDATFDRGVRVARENSAATQRMLIRVNGRERHANYAGRVDGDDSVHRFRYAVADGDTSAGVSGLSQLLALIWHLIFGPQIEAREIQMVDSAFVSVGTQCEARIETDASAAGSLDVMVSRPYTCNYYAADLSLDGLTLN